MAHFAQLDENNIVTNVIVVSNAETVDANGIEDEAIGIGFCKRLFGSNTKWVQTSYNAGIRKNFAGIGYNYDAQRDAFIPPKPFNSWVLVEDTCTWTAPVSRPTSSPEGQTYIWDEDTINWVLVDLPEEIVIESVGSADTINLGSAMASADIYLGSAMASADISLGSAGPV